MKIFFDGTPYLLQELESALSFCFLHHIDFESEVEKEEIRRRGLSKPDVGEEARKRGERFAKQIEEPYLAKVSLRTVSKTIGLGLFAEERIELGEYVGEYTGVVRRRTYLYSDLYNRYRFCYPLPSCEECEYVIDGYKGNLTRFINHSKNANLKAVYAFYDGFYHLIFLALREICPGEHLTFDYGPACWRTLQPELIE